MELSIRSSNIYPGCLVKIHYTPHQEYLNARVVDGLEHKGWMQMDAGRLGVVISVFPNDVINAADRVWMVYFYPVTVAIEQRNLQRVSLSWREKQTRST